jgi:Asp-tRNA(Asn)/Glu-tRNA(Gln) amidotransferase A subunit family amidase
VNDRPKGCRQPWSLRELVADLDTGRVSPADVRARARARVAATEPDVRAWVDPVERNEQHPTPGPLSGVPFGVKDIIDLTGHATRCGSGLRADAAPATEDAAIVKAWRSTGAVPIGKTVTTEFAYFAPGPTANPADPEHTPGGSSSGSAAAVAAGQVPLALGSQTAGSVTRPAAFCGVAALVMTPGRVPADGVFGLSPTLDSHGVLTATVDDLAFAWAAFTGDPDPGAAAGSALRALIWPGFGEVSAPMKDAVQEVHTRLLRSGATVADFPDLGLPERLAGRQGEVMAYEAARERSAELAQAHRLSEPLAELLRRGEATPRAVYLAAREAVDGARGIVLRLLDSCDVIVGPAALGAAPRGLGTTGDPALSRPWQVLGLPTVTVPGLTDARRLPLGIQVVGRPNAEAELLGIACRIERLLTGKGG